MYIRVYSASQSRVALENVDLQKEQKCNTFACHTCNEVRLCVLGIRKRKLATRKDKIRSDKDYQELAAGVVSQS
jgi:hypothetical protein